MKYDKMLAKVNASLESIKKENIEIFAHFLRITNLLKLRFKDNNYCDAAITEITSYVFELLHETDLEYKIYDKIGNYLYHIIYEQTIEGFECSLENELFEGIIKLLDSSYSKRKFQLEYYIEKYKTIIETKCLNNSNYLIFESNPYMTEEKYLKLLETIPKK